MECSGGLDGDTVASTASYLSFVEVHSRLSWLDLQVEEGQLIDIPFREQDDPPDQDGDSAASLSIVRSSMMAVASYCILL
mmetsp:Transcript_28088/g.40205  ORF Transcript_28088/g.40205 Transcript_28088/m.40205 type:complete len:80 (-) Transcript_28088:247-486(-)